MAHHALRIKNFPQRANIFLGKMGGPFEGKNGRPFRLCPSMYNFLRAPMSMTEMHQCMLFFILIYSRHQFGAKFVLQSLVLYLMAHNSIFICNETSLLEVWLCCRWSSVLNTCRNTQKLPPNLSVRLVKKSACLL